MTTDPKSSAGASGLAAGRESPGSMARPVQDLRTLTIEERRALSAEAERRARDGEAPMAIKAALGISTRAYSSWAKLFGFRQCDLFPEAKRTGARATLAPGPGGYARSGRRLRDLPVPAEDGRRVSGPEHPAWTGGAAAARARYQGLRQSRAEAAQAEVEQLDSAAAVLAAVNAAREAGDLARADLLLKAWKARARRARDLAALERDAAAEAADPEALSDDALCAEVSRLLGREVRIKPG